jgi:MoxR-like ATPase
MTAGVDTHRCDGGTAAPGPGGAWDHSHRPAGGDVEAVERLSDAYRRLFGELGKAVVGQQRVLEELLVAVFARGHCLITGVPGLAKTLMVRTLADALDLSFSRVQFTPDMMPSDITGTEVLQEDRTTGQRGFKFLRGPLFAHVILADEINRTPPKTQAALLEAMQEHQVTAGGTRHALPEPFFVLATQNPVEQEGTYPLPEAQQDRFMFNVQVDYPAEDEEYRIVETTTSTHRPQVQRVLSAEDILQMQEVVRRVPVAPFVIRYAMNFTRRTRKRAAAAAPGVGDDVPVFVRDYVTWGAGPRASQYLILGAKARAALHGRCYVACDDVREVAAPVLRHRIILNYNAEADGVTADDIVRRLANLIPKEK